MAAIINASNGSAFCWTSCCYNYMGLSFTLQEYKVPKHLNDINYYPALAQVYVGAYRPEWRLSVHALKGKRIELSTPNSVEIQCMAYTLGMHWPWGQRSKVKVRPGVGVIYRCDCVGILVYICACDVWVGLAVNGDDEYTGGPGSGKGTQCERIVQQYGFTHLSSGDLLREEVNNDTQLAGRIKAIMDQGKLVPLVCIIYCIKHGHSLCLRTLNTTSSRRIKHGIAYNSMHFTPPV